MFLVRVALLPGQGGVLDAGDAGGDRAADLLPVRDVDFARGQGAVYRELLEEPAATDFGISQANLFMRIASLCHQSLVTIDAIVRSIVRMTVTHERLLEWETAAEAESNYAKKSPVELICESTPWLAFLVGAVPGFRAARNRSWSRCHCWFCGVLSKPIGQWLNLPLRKADETRMDAEDEELLRQSALRTWRVFREFSTAEENWLMPDTDSESRLADRSPHLDDESGLAAEFAAGGHRSGISHRCRNLLTDTERTFDSDRSHAKA